MTSIKNTDVPDQQTYISNQAVGEYYQKVLANQDPNFYYHKLLITFLLEQHERHIYSIAKNREKRLDLEELVKNMDNEINWRDMRHNTMQETKAREILQVKMAHQTEMQVLQIATGKEVKLKSIWLTASLMANLILLVQVVYLIIKAKA
jgi:hypothetical protein